MIINFEEMEETRLDNFNGGEGYVAARMLMPEMGKIMLVRIPKGCSIGMHTHSTNCEVFYVMSGKGKAICDGAEEELVSGLCHYCPKNSTHTAINTGDEDLVLFAVIPNQP